MTATLPPSKTASLPATAPPPSDIESEPYLRALGVRLEPAPPKRGRITFTPNHAEAVHRWAPYVQGFSAGFVEDVLARYWDTYGFAEGRGRVIDPFAGSGTVLVSAKRAGVPSAGTELNPLLAYVARVKANAWNADPAALAEALVRIEAGWDAPPSIRPSWRSPQSEIRNRCAPAFLETERHFRPEIRRDLVRLRGLIEELEVAEDVRDLLRVAFAACLTEVSNLKRSPCLGYRSPRELAQLGPDAVVRAYPARLRAMIADLEWLRATFPDPARRALPATVELADARHFTYPPASVDLAITSPPYMNGLDYVMNYKIEMAWLGFTRSHREAKAIKDAMVVCDNVSKGLITAYAARDDRLRDPWVDDLVDRIGQNLARRPTYRRPDMHLIVHKYFDDLHQVLQRVSEALRPGGRLVMVVGDSLIADVYVPTDLLLARIATRLPVPLTVERVEKARNRRSGQRRDYVLRESVVTLVREPSKATGLA